MSLWELLQNFHQRNSGFFFFCNQNNEIWKRHKFLLRKTKGENDVGYIDIPAGLSMLRIQNPSLRDQAASQCEKKTKNIDQQKKDRLSLFSTGEVPATYHVAGTLVRLAVHTSPTRQGKILLSSFLLAGSLLSVDPLRASKERKKKKKTKRRVIDDSLALHANSDKKNKWASQIN